MGRCAGFKSAPLMRRAFSAQLSCAFGREVLSFLSDLRTEQRRLVGRRGWLGVDLSRPADLFVPVARGGEPLCGFLSNEELAMIMGGTMARIFGV